MITECEALHPGAAGPAPVTSPCFAPPASLQVGRGATPDGLGFATVASSVVSRLAAAFVWLRDSKALPALQRRHRRLRVNETVSLGEKRFLSLVEVDGQTFLLGSAAAGITLLATLEAPRKAVETLQSAAPALPETVPCGPQSTATDFSQMLQACSEQSMPVAGHDAWQRGPQRGSVL